MGKNINLYKIFLQNKYVIIVLFLFFISNLNGLFSIPRVMIDEPLYSYTALKFLKTGSFYHDFFAFSGKEFCLYPFVLGIIYSIFGLSFEVGRMFSFFCGLISFLFLFLYCKENNYNDKLTASVLSIFFCSNILFVVYRIIRPEALLSLGFTGLIFFLNSYLKNTRKLVKANILYGIGASLGILSSTHLIGALLSINIVVYFLIFLRKKLRINHIFKIIIGSSPFLLLLGYNFFDQVQRNSHLFSGLADDTMSHGEGWQFLRLGRHIERADKTSRMLDVKYFVLLPSAQYVGTPYDNIQWAAVLKSISALEPYRQRYHRISPQQIVEYLVLDRVFPRSIFYCLASAEDAIHQITGSLPGTFHSGAERQLGKLKSDLSYTDINDVMRVGIHEFLDDFQSKLNEVGQSIFETFFSVPQSQPKAVLV